MRRPPLPEMAGSQAGVWLPRGRATPLGQTGSSRLPAALDMPTVTPWLRAELQSDPASVSIHSTHPTSLKALQTLWRLWHDPSFSPPGAPDSQELTKE